MATRILLIRIVLVLMVLGIAACAGRAPEPDASAAPAYAGALSIRPDPVRFDEIASGCERSQTLEARGEILLSVGNAGGIAISVNDRQGRPLGDSGEVRRNIRITKQNLSNLLAEPPAFPVSESS